MEFHSGSTVNASSSVSHPFKKFKIGLCQLSVTSDKSNNIVRARNSIEFAAKQGASLVLLPEMWNCPYSDDFFAKFAEDFDDKEGSLTYSMLSQVASLRGVTIVGGSIPERSAGQLYNTCCVFGPDGDLIAKHRKIHLFDVNMPGDISFKESDSFTAGGEPTIVDTVSATGIKDLPKPHKMLRPAENLNIYGTNRKKVNVLTLHPDVGRIGLGICHDIRFPELAMLYRSRGAHLICYPGAFNMSTGESLWELEQRARAADNQLYVATCSPSRESAGSYEIWGHSSLVGPSGEFVATCGHEETIVIAEVDYSEIERARQSLPIEKQRLENMYQLIDVHEQQKLSRN